MKFQLPEDITGLSKDDLAKLRVDAVAEHKVLIGLPDDRLTDDDLDSIESLVAAIDAIDTQVSSVTEAETARAARIAAARDKNLDEKVVEAPEAEAIVVEEQAPAELVDVVIPDDASELIEQETVVTASANRVDISKLGGGDDVLVVPVAKPVHRLSITASAESVGVAPGSELEGIPGIRKAAVERFKSMSRGRAGVQNRYPVAKIQKSVDYEFSQENKTQYRDDVELFKAAGDEHRLPGGSLIAAGGWCAPSETIYDLTNNASLDGLIDLPEVQITRGGISFTKGIEFEGIFDAILTMVQTEAEAEAGEEKECYDVECPDFEDVRMEAVYLCIRAGILTNHAYPELIDNTIAQVLIAHQHKVSARVIQKITTLAGAAQTIADMPKTAVGVLSMLGLLIDGERQRYRLELNDTLEVLLPFWLKSAVRADLALKNGIDYLAVTDAEIISFFTVRGARAQWLYNWQPLAIGTTGAPTAATDYPANLEVIAYPAGTFVKGVTDVITLDAVYDSTGLSTNTYTALFAEEGLLVANVNYTARRVTMPLFITGLSAAANLNQNLGTATAASTVLSYQSGPLV